MITLHESYVAKLGFENVTSAVASYVLPIRFSIFDNSVLFKVSFCEENYIKHKY